MKTKSWQALLAKYQTALGAYLARGQEADLQLAYELGRSALNLGFGVLDVMRLHQEAVGKLVTADAPATPKATKAVDAFLLEMLSPFEVAHRGFRDACERLRGLNETLEQRNEELGASNRKLASEIARRKNTQEALQESELKFRSVIESAQDAIITIDSNGRVVTVNRSAEALFGYGPDELLGKPVTRLIPKSLRDAAQLKLTCLAAGTEEHQFKRPIESCGLHRSGQEIPLEFTLASWRTRNGVFFTGVVRDIRERRQAEEALRESREHYIRLFKEARAMEENLRLLSSKVLSVQEEERKQISRELHDEIGQALTAVNVSLAMLRSHAAGDEALSKKVNDTQRLIEQSMDMVNRFARDLRPSMLDHLGPVAALQNYMKLFTERTGIKTELEGSVTGRLDNEQRTVLYRIAQESLTNIFKHAKATRVKIRLRQLAHVVSMEISDNGCAIGAPVGAEKDETQTLGLLGMKERVRLVNGELAIESAPRRGTTVRLQIPLPSNPDEPARTEPSALVSASN